MKTDLNVIAPPSDSAAKPSSVSQARLVAIGTARQRRRASSAEVIATASKASRLASKAPEAELKRVRFGYFNPNAQSVFVAGSFNNWNTRATPMTRDALGDWSIELRLPGGEYRYRFLVDGEWRDDPWAQLTAINTFGSFDAIVSV